MCGELIARNRANQASAWDIAFLQDEQLTQKLQRQIQVRLDGLGNYDSLLHTLRDVRLTGDKTVKVYEHTTIQPKKCAIADLSPIALYALHAQIAQHKRLFWHLHQFGQNLFDLVGTMTYTQSGTQYCLAPPIVETYIEPTTGRYVTAIIDGLHRILAARQLGLEEIWVIEVTDVLEILPPIALPVSWDDVVLCERTPPTHTKRRYRFNSAADYPNLTTVTRASVTPSNYRYFLYRDLAALGSEGIRTTTA